MINLGKSVWFDPKHYQKWTFDCQWVRCSPYYRTDLMRSQFIEFFMKHVLAFYDWNNCYGEMYEEIIVNHDIRKKYYTKIHYFFQQQKSTLIYVKVAYVRKLILYFVKYLTIGRHKRRLRQLQAAIVTRIPKMPTMTNRQLTPIRVSKPI